MNAAGGTFRHTARIRFHQADPAGVLFYGRVFELVNEAYEELVRAAGFVYDDHFGMQDYATPVVHVEADYRRPMPAGAQVTVELTVSRIGRSSFTLAFTIQDAAGAVCAEGTVVHTFVRADTFSTIEIPPEVRAALAGYAPGSTS
jgi:YbgC/YbaW family acyl-CoA thioester hydrolase